MPYGSLASVENAELGQEDKGAERHKHKHKTKLKDKMDTSMVVETDDISVGVDMDVDVALQSSEKKERKGKKIRHGGVAAESVSQSTVIVSNLPISEENKAIKKRKELPEVVVEGKKNKKLKTKGA